MKIKAICFITLMAGSVIAIAQTNSTSSTNEPADDWKPATSNQPGKQYPQVNSERRVRARVVAPEAQSVYARYWRREVPSDQGR